MNKSDYIVIQAPMVTDLNLSGNRLIIYALIHGFCKDGESEFTGSINYICEWTNLTRNTVISTLKSLVEDNLLTKREYTSNNVRFCSYSLGSAKFTLPVQISLNSDERGSAKISPNNIEIIKDIENNKEDNIEKENSKKEKSSNVENEFVEKIYKLYPTKCPVRKTSLGKTSKDKDRIRKLLKSYSMEIIERVVKAEIEEKYGKHYMQNFSTFLNNFPDPNSLFGEESSEDAALRRAYETLSSDQEAEIYGIENKAWFSELTESQREYWRKECRDKMLKYINGHNGQ